MLRRFVIVLYAVLLAWLAFLAANIHGPQYQWMVLVLGGVPLLLLMAVRLIVTGRLP